MTALLPMHLHVYRYSAESQKDFDEEGTLLRIMAPDFIFKVRGGCEMVVFACAHFGLGNI